MVSEIRLLERNDFHDCKLKELSIWLLFVVSILKGYIVQ